MMVKTLALLITTLFCFRASAAESCHQVFSGATAVLSELKEHLDSPANRVFDHAIVIRDDKVVLKIGYLVRDGDRSFSRLLYKAIATGAVNEINAGAVVGPKVLPLLLSLKKIAPHDQPLEVRGIFWVHMLKRALKNQLEGVPRTDGEGANLNENANRWSQSELDAYASAVKTLGLDEMFEAIGNREGYVDFRFDARHPETIVLRKRKRGDRPLR